MAYPMKFLKIPRKQAEKTRHELIEQDIFSGDYPILNEGEFILLPVTKKWKHFEIVERDVEKRPHPDRRLKDALSNLLTEREFENLIASFDIIGDIAIMEIPRELEPKDSQIGEALLKVHRNIKTVLKKQGPMEGEFRVRKLQRIAGEERTETIYKESGLKMKLDVSKVYFSVRLAHERLRIAKLVSDGERVLVLFAGVGPFALVIANTNPNAKIVAVEINPDAVRYMEENIVLNKIKNVEAIEGDVRDLMRIDFVRGSFDRIIMPLPKTASAFLDVAFSVVKDGGSIHFYTLADANTPFEDAFNKAKIAASASSVSVEILSQRIVRPYSPTTVQVVLDLKVRKTQ